jgi:hypothetical protein
MASLVQEHLLEEERNRQDFVIAFPVVAKKPKIDEA